MPSKPKKPKPKVFIAHASDDNWVAQQIARSVRLVSAQTFLDSEDMDHGDDSEEAIARHAESCTELLVLFTPAARGRPWVWREIAMFQSMKKRVVFVLYGLTDEHISDDPYIAETIKRLIPVGLNEIQSYFDQLAKRVQQWKRQND